MQPESTSPVPPGRDRVGRRAASVRPPCWSSARSSASAPHSQAPAGPYRRATNALCTQRRRKKGNSPKFAVTSSPAPPRPYTNRDGLEPHLAFYHAPNCYVYCQGLIQAVATCYSPDFREFLHCPTPISHAATKMSWVRVMLQGVPAL